MHISSFLLSVAALATAVVAAPLAEASQDCVTEYHTTWVQLTTTVTSTAYTTSSCPIVSLPLSPIVTGTLVPVKSILSDVSSLVGGVTGLLPRAPEPTQALEARNGCKVTAWKTSTTYVATATHTVTETVKPSCNIVNV